MKHLKKFNEHQQYQNFIDGNFFLPNVSYCKNQKDVHYNPRNYDFFCKIKLNDDSVITVEGSGAFTKTILNSVQIPSGKLIKSVIFGDKCTDIFGESVFENKTTIQEVYISKTITTIGRSPFRGCTSLKTIVVDKANSVYDSRNNCNAIIHTSTNEIIQGCKKTIIPNTVISIGTDAFSKHDLSTNGITIPEGVTTLQTGAFSSCSLESIVIPDSMITIGRYAFQANPFTSIEIPDNVTTIGYSALNSCNNLSTVIIGSGVTQIDDSAFGFDGKLRTIICKAMTAPSIHQKAFEGLAVYGGQLKVPSGSTGYNVWISSTDLGSHNWTLETF